MRVSLIFFCSLLLLCGLGDCQLFDNLFRGFNNGLRNVFRPVRTMFERGPFRPPSLPFGGNRRPNRRPSGALGSDGGTPRPQASGNDPIYPDDCGRDPIKGTGNLCFPDGLLCKQRTDRVGNKRFGNHLYWMSWESDDPKLRSGEWSWFNARNYCRKRCMDLVSIESRQEYEWIKQQIQGVKYIWTSGRLCNFDGCDRGDFFPKGINGWFWSANQDRLAPTNSTTEFQDWSFTGGAGVRQPDNREGRQGGEEEACLAVLNNFYGDGIKWHDVSCEHEKPIICEDTEGHIQFARQHFPNLNIP